MKIKKNLSLVLSLFILITALPYSVGVSAATVSIPSDALEFNGHYYKRYDSSVSWSSAKTACENMGGHLVTINSSSEQSFLISLTNSSSKKNMWIGAKANSNGVYSWVTGEDFSYTNWASEEPNNVFNSQFTAMMYTYKASYPAGTWNDENENGRDWSGYRLSDFGYICEWDSEHLQPYLSPESAAMFIGFLTNNKDLTEAEIKADPRYQIMTNTYTGSDKARQITALINFAVNATSEMASKAVDNSAFLNKEIIKYLEKELGSQTEIPEDEINDLQNEELSKIDEIFYDLINDLLPVSADSYFKVTDIYDYYSSVIGAAEKGKKYAERIAAAMEGCFLAMESEKAGRYTHFSNYIHHRGNYDSADNESFKILIEYSRLANADNNWFANFLNLFTWITGKSSFNKNFDVIEEWAEYIYQLSCYNNDCKSETVANNIDTNNLTYATATTNATISNVDTSVSGAIVLPDNMDDLPITVIDDGAFEDCALVESIKIGDNVETINQNAFKGCSALKTISISHKVTEIGDNAFENCSSLEQIIIPNSITYISESAFKNCSENLTFICDCKNKYVIEYCVANGYNYSLTHNFNNYISNNNGTCKEYGTLTSKCDNCDFTDTINDYESMECLSSEWIVTTKPTLTEFGFIQQKCIVCDEMIAEESILLGDADNNSYLSSGDLVNFRKKLLGDLEIEAWQTYVFDINENGSIDLRDLVKLKKHFANTYYDGPAEVFPDDWD